LRDDGNIDGTIFATGVYGALLKCKAPDAPYGRLGMPLPAELTIVPPTADVSPELAMISGVWFGTLYGYPEKSSQSVLLVVQYIDNYTATVIHSYRYQDGTGGWDKVSYRVAENNTLERILPSGKTFRFRLVNGKLEGERIADGRRATITMTKQER